MSRPHVDDVAEHESDLRPLHQRHLRGQAIGKPDVIGVDERDQLSVCVTQPAIARHVRARMRLLDDRDLRSETVEHIARAVGRAVIDDDQLERRLRLREDAANRARDRLLAVVDGEDDGDGIEHRGLVPMITTFHGVETRRNPSATLTFLPRAKLLTVLGVTFGLAVTVGNMIGAGILRTPGDIAAQLPTFWPFITVWIVGGLYALLGANALAELGTLVPESGGQYVFVRRALGDYAGLLVGWSDWISTCGTTAAVSIVIGEYSLVLFPAPARHRAGRAGGHRHSHGRAVVRRALGRHGRRTPRAC